MDTTLTLTSDSFFRSLPPISPFPIALTLPHPSPSLFYPLSLRPPSSDKDPAAIQEPRWTKRGRLFDTVNWRWVVLSRLSGARRSRGFRLRPALLPVSRGAPPNVARPQPWRAILGASPRDQGPLVLYSPSWDGASPPLADRRDVRGGSGRGIGKNRPPPVVPSRRKKEKRERKSLGETPTVESPPAYLCSFVFRLSLPLSSSFPLSLSLSVSL